MNVTINTHEGMQTFNDVEYVELDKYGLTGGKIELTLAFNDRTEKFDYATISRIEVM